MTITRRGDGRVDLGMFCPATGRHEPLGTHGPLQRDVDRAVRGLCDKIQREGHLLTFSDVSAPR